MGDVRKQFGLSDGLIHIVWARTVHQHHARNALQVSGVFGQCDDSLQQIRVLPYLHADFPVLFFPCVSCRVFSRYDILLFRGYKFNSHDLPIVRLVLMSKIQVQILFLHAKMQHMGFALFFLEGGIRTEADKTTRHPFDFAEHPGKGIHRHIAANLQVVIPEKPFHIVSLNKVQRVLFYSVFRPDRDSVPHLLGFSQRGGGKPPQNQKECQQNSHPSFHLITSTLVSLHPFVQVRVFSRSICRHNASTSANERSEMRSYLSCLFRIFLSPFWYS